MTGVPRTRIRHDGRLQAPCLIASFVGLALVIGFAASSAASDVVFRETFDEGEKETELRRRVAEHDRCRIVPGSGPDGSAALVVACRGNKTGSEGISTAMPLPEAGDEFSLSYDLRFDPGFDFSRGGKLPGLGPETPVTGGRPVTEAGWSARPMWREEGLLTSYTYHQDKKIGTGDYRRSEGVLLPRGRFVAVTVQVRVNSGPEASDGRVAIYLDGELAVSHPDLRLRRTRGDEGVIARLLFSVFHGGNDASWAPRNAEGEFAIVKAYFDNIEVRRGIAVRRAPIAR